jgi:hypothetical protein
MARALQRGRCAGLRVPQWLMDGTDATTVSAAGSFNPGPTWHVKASADFDGDGKSDILWQGDDGTAAMWLMDGPQRHVRGRRRRDATADVLVAELRQVNRDFRVTGVMERGQPGQTYSGLMLAARITLAHFSVSSAMSLPKSAGVRASMMPPRSLS